MVIAKAKPKAIANAKHRIVIISAPPHRSVISHAFSWRSHQRR